MINSFISLSLVSGLSSLCQVNLNSINVSALIKSVYHIKEYLAKTKSHLSKKSSNEILSLIDSLISNNTRSSFSTFTSIRTTNRFKSIESQRFSDDWIVNRTSLLSDLRDFHQKSTEYRTSLEYLNYIDRKESYRQSSEEIESISSDDNSSKKVRFADDSYQLKPCVPKFSRFRIESPSFNIKPLRLIASFSVNFSKDLVKVKMPKSSNSNVPWAEISREQWEALQKNQQTLNDILRALHLSNQTMQVNLQALQDNNRQQFMTPPSIAESIQSDNRWNAAEIEFFDPLYDEKSAATENAIEHSEKDIYFRNVHVFIEKVKDMTQIKDDILIRNNLYSCLRDIALAWYTSNLSDDHKRLIKFDTEIDEWIRILLKKFKQSFETVLATVIRKKYTMKDVKKRRKPVEYAQIIIKAAKSAEMSVYNQIYLIFNDLDVEFQRNLNIPTETTELDAFLQELNLKKKIWWTLKSRSRFVRPMNETSDNRNYRYENRYSNQSQSYSNERYSNVREYKDSPYQNNSTPFQVINHQIDYSNNRNHYRTQGSASAPQTTNTSHRYVYAEDKKKQNAYQSYRNLPNTNPYQAKPSTSFVSERRSLQKTYHDDDQEFQNTYDEQKNTHDENNNLHSQEKFHENIMFVQNENKVSVESNYQNDDISQNFFVDSSTMTRQCRRCELNYFSNNKLHKHLKTCKKNEKTNIKAYHEIIEARIVQSNFKISCENPDLNFKTWHYLMIRASIQTSMTILNSFCIDTDCGMFIIDRKYLKDVLSNFESKIKSSSTPMKVREIDDSTVISSDYITIDFSIPETLKDKPAIVRFFRKLHIVDSLSTKVLIDMNIIDSERMTISASKLRIDSCQNILINLSTKVRNPSIKRVVTCAIATTLNPHTSLMIFIKLRENIALSDRDFIFHSSHNSSLRPEGGALSHIVNANFSTIQVSNASHHSVTIPRRMRLEMLCDYNEKRCYLTSPENAHLAIDQWTTTNIRSVTRAFFEESIIEIQNKNKNFTKAKTLTKLILNNEITIYDVKKNQAVLAQIAESYSDIWKDNDTPIKITSDQWMTILIKPDAKVTVAKVYSVGPKDRALIDDLFDRMHEQDRMKWSTTSTRHDYPVFVTWRTILKPGQEPIRKERVMIDIRSLNKIAETNSYSMSLQTDITSAISDCTHIIVIDVVEMFYQWSVKKKNRHKFTVMSHREQKQFNVAIMRYKNSPSYVQRQVDTILKSHKNYVRDYIDDIVIFSKSLKEHVQHLHVIFQLFSDLNISLSLKKSFLEYSIVQLLEEKVNAFDLTTAAEKIEAIFKLKFLANLKELETYLDFIDWLRRYCLYYAQKSNALQQLKTSLLRNASKKDQPRKSFSIRTDLKSSIPNEIDSFNQIQETFSKTSFLHHFDTQKTLFADIDASKTYDFEIMIYHLKNDWSLNKDNRMILKPAEIELILFLSRMLSNVEHKLFSTELEMTALIWTVKRIKHMIESATKTTIIFIDHVANPSIARQTTLSSENIDKLNLKLVRASTYLSQFDLNIRYRSEKNNIMLDALSRLSSNAISKDAEIDTLDIESYHSSITDVSLTNHAFQGSLMIISREFRQKILNEYKNKPWSTLIEMLIDLLNRLSNETRSEEPSKSSQHKNARSVKTEIDFELKDDLLYHKTDNKLRLCIPKALKKDIFKLTHDDNQHAEVTRFYARIVESLYILKLFRKLRTYITHCPTCQLNQTKRHRPYEELMSIICPTISFHTIAMNFILTIPEKNYDTLLTITCKYSKRIAIISEKTIYNAKDWVKCTLNRLLTANWKLSAAIISNRDLKFISDFWQQFFVMLDTDILTTTAYHPQADEQFERSNQTIEIAIRFLYANNPDVDVIVALSSIQAQLNNSLNASTELCLNEIIYEFKVRESLSALNNNTFDISSEALSKLRLLYRKKASDAISFANSSMKIYYDSRHVPLLLKPDDKTYLRLHKRYNLSNDYSKKLSAQRCDPFTVKKRVERLAYELKLSPTWRVHPVISVTQLKPVTLSSDPYNRLRPDYPDSVHVEGDTENNKSYEVEKILSKRMKKFERTNVTQYLIRWLKYDSKYDEWRSINTLDNCLQLVKKYETELRATK